MYEAQLCLKEIKITTYDFLDKFINASKNNTIKLELPRDPS